MKKRITPLILFFVYFLAAFQLHAQNEGTLEGTVRDDLGPLFGASVIIKGQGIGTIADFDGNYSLTIKEGEYEVEFSYIGYTSISQRIKIRAQEVITLNVTLLEGLGLDEIIVIGSRSEGRTKINSVAPIDIIPAKEMMREVPQTNINHLMNLVAPSFTSNTQTIADGTDHLDPASLRGLGPDQVLVLINGKRRHTSSLVNVNGTFGRGNVGTDMNAIPMAAVERIEVLRDGASAQYGSDAIAGVINLILKEDFNHLRATIGTGAFFFRRNPGSRCQS